MSVRGTALGASRDGGFAGGPPVPGTSSKLRASGGTDRATGCCLAVSRLRVERLVLEFRYLVRLHLNRRAHCRPERRTMPKKGMESYGGRSSQGDDRRLRHERDFRNRPSPAICAACRPFIQRHCTTTSRASRICRSPCTNLRPALGEVLMRVSTANRPSKKVGP